jgi:uncharacterized YccA/Bax inhibitor family protein
MQITNTVLAVIIGSLFLLFGGVGIEIGLREVGIAAAIVGMIFMVCAAISYLDEEELKQRHKQRYG